MNSTIPNRPTMTMREVVNAMRDVGFRTSETTVADGIKSGRYPFGALLGTGRTGRRRFEALRVDFERWIEEVTKCKS